MHIGSLWELLVAVPAILLAVTFHEYAHGKVAYLLGDPTPKYQGRLTLNPLAHLDPLGTLLFVLAGFGWAKPVQVNPFYFHGDRRRGMMLVSLAGPLMNLVLAYLAAVASRVLVFAPFYIKQFLFAVVMYNIILAVFNLIPVPPLDGSKILAGLLPPQHTGIIYQLETYGPLILLLLIFTGFIGLIMNPLIRVVYSLITLLSGMGYY
ncbi:site-2 protease family protein [Calderihabitans maritimus]|uniref:Peptidase M50 n=1 Tax=Calderihabitans maritimus TaxID=1246530 RepID=A0A1Z5HWJ9_9FIRM|nr:site-2 protease family protein [Calderihabitans maritimus]GAW93909.1 peptidase M50 [Calderihabitans maritimus]